MTKTKSIKKSSTKKKITKTSKVAIIMGSKNDQRIMRDAIRVLRQFGVSHQAYVVSAHRTPEFMFSFAREAQERGFDLIIAGAGGAAHLPGMVASLTTLPVIGVPISVGKLKGLDALLSIAQMPKGVPVATVAVDNAHNAGLLAARILGVRDLFLRKKVERLRQHIRRSVLKKKVLTKRR